MNGGHSLSAAVTTGVRRLEELVRELAKVDATQLVDPAPSGG